MRRDVAVLILLVALLAMVLLFIDGDEPGATAPVTSDLSPAAGDTTNANPKKGIAWANWRDRDATDLEPPLAPDHPELPPAGGIPREVREKLARDYKGMDVYISRGAGDE